MATRRRTEETLSRWDAADYLKSEEDMAAYLRACLEEAPDDPAFIAAALGDVARVRGMVQLAKETGRETASTRRPQVWLGSFGQISGRVSGRAC